MESNGSQHNSHSLDVARKYIRSTRRRLGNHYRPGLLDHGRRDVALLLGQKLHVTGIG